MAQKPSAPTQNPGTQVLPAPPITKKAPLYHVILHDDDTHSYQYVIVMLMQLFGKSPERAFEHAKEVDSTGVTIVETTNLERAELKADQIRAFGPDPLITNSTGSMSATIEPA
jgi:ATP-dependent Clp protease adaptor protein ClpS